MDGRDLEEGFFWTVGGEWGRFGVLKEELGREVLRDVSRSFYLTLRLLPEGMRDATSVGYLLARLSDTIADCGGARSERMELLGRYQEVLRTGVEGGFLGKLAGIGEDAGLSEGERVLVRRFREVLQWWGELEAWKRREVREVALRISGGQLWDLKRFPEGEVVRLERGEELEEYCYAVAGCVGEFWTEVGFGCEEGFARKSREEMRELGRRYGKGLQLVNI
ncbi:MAG: squalene/phytoene synthase family protein [Verrucomicrobiota bacterium]